MPSWEAAEPYFTFFEESVKFDINTLHVNAPRSAFTSPPPQRIQAYKTPSPPTLPQPSVPTQKSADTASKTPSPHTSPSTSMASHVSKQADPSDVSKSTTATAAATAPTPAALTPAPAASARKGRRKAAPAAAPASATLPGPNDPLNYSSSAQGELAIGSSIPLGIKQGADDMTTVQGAAVVWVQKLRAALCSSNYMAPPQHKGMGGKKALATIAMTPDDNKSWNDWQANAMKAVVKKFHSRNDVGDLAEARAWKVYEMVVQLHTSGYDPLEAGNATIDPDLKCSERLNEVVAAISDYPLIRLDVLGKSGIYKLVLDPERAVGLKRTNHFNNTHKGLEIKAGKPQVTPQSSYKTNARNKSTTRKPKKEEEVDEESDGSEDGETSEVDEKEGKAGKVDVKPKFTAKAKGKRRAKKEKAVVADESDEGEGSIDGGKKRQLKATVKPTTKAKSKRKVKKEETVDEEADDGEEGGKQGKQGLEEDGGGESGEGEQAEKAQSPPSKKRKLAPACRKPARRG